MPINFAIPTTTPTVPGSLESLLQSSLQLQNINSVNINPALPTTTSSPPPASPPPTAPNIVVDQSGFPPEDVQRSPAGYLIEAIAATIVPNDIFNFTSDFSEPLHANTLFIPTLDVKFIYNFFTEREQDLNNERLDLNIYNDVSLQDTPEYINISWAAAPNLANSNNPFINSLNNGSGNGEITTFINGNDFSIIDLNDQETAFNNFSNNALGSLGVTVQAITNEIDSTTLASTILNGGSGPTIPSSEINNSIIEGLSSIAIPS